MSPINQPESMSFSLSGQQQPQALQLMQRLQAVPILAFSGLCRIPRDLWANPKTMVK
jgi:hypothetical protein